MIEMSNIYAKVKNQFIFKYQLTFLVIFSKHGKDIEILSETQLSNTLGITLKLTESGLDNSNTQWTLENRLQSIQIEESRENFQKINTMKISFYKSGELNGSSYVKIPRTTSAHLNVKNDDKFSSLWSVLAKLHLCNNDHPNRESNFRQYSNELNTEFIDFY